MRFLAIADDLLINSDHIVSIEKSKNKIKLTTVDGKQHIVEKDYKDIAPDLLRAGVDTPRQFWAG